MPLTRSYLLKKGVEGKRFVQLCAGGKHTLALTGKYRTRLLLGL